MNNGKAILAVLAGVTAGAVFGMLFAPGKGRSTREKIAKKGEDLADALNDKIDRKFEELLTSFTSNLKEPVKNSSQTEKNESV
ncbi:hypothetical protein SanaruYs_05730 [Chryseotalea sanaruensis]|uniref:YtxH domain-containing protein n=1 Tax=Chryseotalea sanaruensis TaxID=2482724 RepID=A0A401U602_9BACT|nr:YtxH domain-containing protein [Chryseotalea sanaruensis]GCC50358.1 hypothetical protein SanaruYs_05730 [Chryseotalea sanaruensis]